MSKVDFGQAGTSALGSAGSGLFGSLLGMAAARQQFKYQKKSMALQQAYNEKNFKAENDRQDWLLQNQQSMTKQGLKNAGYSVADPNGIGVSGAAVNQLATPQPTGPDVSIPNVDLLGSYQSLKNAELIANQNRLLEAQAKEHETKVDQIKQDIKYSQETLPEVVNQLKADVQLKLSNKEINEHQANQIDKNIEHLNSVITGLNIDNKYKEELNHKQVQILAQEVVGLMKDNRIKEAEAKLADKGIVIGADGLATLIGVAASGKAGDILPAITDALGSFVGSMPSAIKDVVLSIFSTAGSLIDDGGDFLKKLHFKLKDFFNE